MYDSQVFDIIDRIDLSERGELEITSVNNEYIARGQLQYSFMRGRWTDAGTFESLNEANEMLLRNDNKIIMWPIVFYVLARSKTKCNIFGR